MGRAITYRKWLFAGFLSIFIAASLLLPTIAHGASKSIRVYVNDVPITFESKPQVMQGTTMVPFRTLFESFGMSVQWVPETKTIIGKRDGLVIQLTIGKKTAIVNGSVIKLERAPNTLYGTTYVPLRFVGEATGAQVSWDPEAQTIHIQESNSTGGEETVTPPSNGGNGNGSNTGSVTETNPTPPITTTTPPTTEGKTIEQIGAENIGRIVFIEVLDDKGKEFATGSGIVTSSDGIIATNYHVIEGAAKARVIFENGTKYETSTVLNYNEERDVALLKISASGLNTVNWADSSQVKLGESVVAIGSPLGLQNTLSTGVVSSTSRKIGGMSYIQMTAPIDHGSSGGAVFNKHGQVIGMTVAKIDSSASVNLAIPANEVIEYLNKPHKNFKMPLNSETSPPSSGGGSGKAMTNKQLENYLNDEYGILTYDNYEFDVSYTVSTSDDGKATLVGIDVDGSNEVLNFLDFVDDYSNEGVLDMMMYVSDEIQPSTGKQEVVIGLFINFETSKYPDITNITKEEISKVPGGYEVNHFYSTVFADYKNKRVAFTLAPLSEKYKTEYYKM